MPGVFPNTLRRPTPDIGSARRNKTDGPRVYLSKRQILGLQKGIKGWAIITMTTTASAAGMRSNA
jgi:hypothetical protein